MPLPEPSSGLTYDDFKRGYVFESCDDADELPEERLAAIRQWEEGWDRVMARMHKVGTNKEKSGDGTGASVSP